MAKNYAMSFVIFFNFKIGFDDVIMFMKIIRNENEAQ
jgi:hypothetical protein